jgi:hypothetical protein
MNNVKEKTKTNTIAVENTHSTDELLKVGVNTMGIMSVAIGGWGIACMVSGLISAGGPLALVQGFITAVTGL